jgi:metal-responsive CopG/Arc/MetJ family transcriptional regulator
MTISLPDKMRKEINRAAKTEGVTQSEFVRRAVRGALFRGALRSARLELVPQARRKGIYTDEDVFRSIS